ncbi:MAG: small multi-drug export protein [Actinobacteria bacterium]|nr:small multi-drug export protein [Actinomycetota bacterium]
MDFKEAVEFLSPRLVTFVTAMIPVGELRASIPLALITYQMGIIESYIISVIGNLVPVAVILWGLDSISRYLIKRFRPANRFFTWLFNRTRRKYSARFEKYTGYALIGFVALPLPVTGGWTGALIAFVFGIPPKRAMIQITAGVLIAGIIVTVIIKTVGLVRFITAG